MTNIILCGGSGTRLWPISRTLFPKQFVKLFDERSLFQLTVKRNSKLCDDQMIVSNSEQYFLALDQLEELNESNNNYILEPEGRNTAPSIALACMSLNKDDIVLVTPSDHLVKNEKEYANVVAKAKEYAAENCLVTFGIEPAYAETGFGYIEAQGDNVKAFHEKPDLETANRYIKENNYFWNSGMFCFKAGVFLDELKKYSPQIYETSLHAFQNSSKDPVVRIKSEDMCKIPQNSIDYAVMEKSSIVKVVKSDIAWSDVGSFDALSKELPNDENDNFIISKKRVELVDINDLIVVDTDDALLISKKGSSQKVKDIVTKLNKEGSSLTTLHNTVHRPWGTYTVLEEDNGYKIKKIVVKPNKRLSLQKHFHRNEHWIVLSGIAAVSVEDNNFLVRPNESTYIKSGETHRLENNGKLPLVMIEVQVGEYTGEDDIVRIEDDYKRG